MGYEVQVLEYDSEKPEELSALYTQRFEENPLERVVLALNRPPRKRKRKVVEK